jgi:hypothetical protein
MAGRLGLDERAVEVIDSRRWTREQMRRPDAYAQGDVLTFHRPLAGFMPDEIAMVQETGPAGLLLSNSTNPARWVHPMILHGIDVGTARTVSIAAGDRLLIRANHATAGLKNGDLVEIRSLPSDGRIELADGRAVPATFRHFTHGYATTSHASQGKTVDHGILLLGPLGIQAANLKQAYVSNSRFREQQLIFTTDKAAAVAAMERNDERKLAVESLTVWPRLKSGRGRVVRFTPLGARPVTLKSTGT